MQLTNETLEFIRNHADDDVRSLALKGRVGEGIDLPFALDQIAGRQKARTKLPAWARIPDLVFPPHISMEQCSSEPTALYKRSILERFLAQNGEEAQPEAMQSKGDAENHIPYIYYDLTGGFGVDFSYIATLFGKSVYVEMQEHLCDIARHNFPLLNLAHSEVVCCNSESMIAGICNSASAGKTVLFLDPARRDTHGTRTYAIEDCTPNVLGFIGATAAKVRAVMLKLSPMLDWHATVASLNAACCSHNAVREVHIVSVGNECKEILVLLSECETSPLVVHCVNDAEEFAFTPTSIQTAITVPDSAFPDANALTLHQIRQRIYGKSIDIASDSLANFSHERCYLYVPNASLMKAGCFIALGNHFSLAQIGINSHLFIGNSVDGFPGRKMRIVAVSTMNKKELKSKLQGIERANIATRNFPLTPEQLRKRLKLKDGGPHYIFATTDDEREHLLFVCTKEV